MSQGHQITNITDIQDFIVAGKAIFTVVNSATGARFTFKVKQAKDRQTGEPTTLWFVSVLAGSQNDSDYAYLGILTMKEWRINGRGMTQPSRIQYQRTAKSRIGPDALSQQAFAWLARQVFLTERLPEAVEFWHEGRCGRCARRLTVPESILSGLGPVCAQVMAA